jgi:putative membrane protein
MDVRRDLVGGMICAVSDADESGSALPGSVDRSAATRDHLANERTLLAWQRTALALLGLGFIVDRFAFEGRGTSVAGSILGLALIAIGALASVAGTIRFLRTERDIDQATYRPAHLAHLLLTGATVVGAVLLVLLLVLEPAL